MTSYEAISKIVQAATDDDLVEAERILEKYFQERVKEDLMRGMERVNRGGYFCLERKIELKKTE